jgi:hypothetical protein
MDKTKPLIATSALLCFGLAACSGNRANAELTIEGSFTGTTETQCQLALRVVGSEELVDSVAVGSDFRQVFKVEPDKKQYFVQVSCPDGKYGRSQDFYFEPPRSGMQLPQILVN